MQFIDPLKLCQEGMAREVNRPGVVLSHTIFQDVEGLLCAPFNRLHRTQPFVGGVFDHVHVAVDSSTQQLQGREVVQPVLLANVALC